MTIFRYDRLDAADVSMSFISSNEPDTIGVAFEFEGNGLFEMHMGESGETTVLFDEIENTELLLTDLHALFQKSQDELKNWHARLSEPGQMWARS